MPKKVVESEFEEMYSWGIPLHKPRQKGVYVNQVEKDLWKKLLSMLTKPTNDGTKT